jgi:predicted GIY-YIG superfamily endonuclease
MAAADTPGTIYLLHFTTPTERGRRHYLGWSERPTERLRQHQSGRGAAETRRAIADGAKLIMAQTWSGTPALERRLKDWSRSRRAGFAGLCPICQAGMPLPRELSGALGPGSMKRIYHSTSA